MIDVLIENLEPARRCGVAAPTARDRRFQNYLPFVQQVSALIAQIDLHRVSRPGLRARARAQPDEPPKHQKEFCTASHTPVIRANGPGRPSLENCGTCARLQQRSSACASRPLLNYWSTATGEAN